MIGQRAPSSEIDRLVDRIARLEERIADLQRTTGAWPVVPWVAVEKSAPQSIPNNALTAVTWNVEVADAWEMHAGGALSKLTVPAGLDGVWRVSYGLQWDANSVGDRLAYVAVNGSFTRHAMSEIPMTSPGYCGLTGSADLELAGGDYVEVVVYQSSGGSLNINVSAGADFTATFQGRAS